MPADSRTSFESAGTLSAVLSQLPCWKRLTPEAYRTRIAVIRQIEATAASERTKRGVEPLGVEKILAQDPGTSSRPPTTKKGQPASQTPPLTLSARQRPSFARA